MLARKTVVFLVYTFLFVSCMSDRAKEMEVVLDRAELQNQNFDSITHVDSIVMAAEFYDNHGNSNERMRACYLLGCAYRDMGNSPLALEYYNNAIEAADTLDGDCNFKLLSRIYGQKAEILENQALPARAIQESRYAYHYAMKAGDTLSAYIFYGSIAPNYYSLGKRDSSLYVCRRAEELLKTFGDTCEGNTNLAVALMIYSDRHDYEHLSECLDLYENHSYLTGVDSFVNDRHNLLYYYKGLYFMGTSQFDSANTAFRTLDKKGRSLNNKGLAAYGLYNLYKSLGIKDSMVLYADRYTSLNDSMAKMLENSMIMKQQVLYNYTQYQKLSYQKEHEAEVSNARMYLILLALVAFVMAFVAYYWRSIASKRQYEARIARYQLLLEKANCATPDEKDRQANALQSIFGSGLRRTLVEKAERNTKATDEEWQQMADEIIRTYPSFDSAIREYLKTINTTNYRICLGVKFQLQPNQIAVLLPKSKQTVTTARSRMYRSIFKKTGKASDFDKFIHSIGF